MATLRDMRQAPEKGVQFFANRIKRTCENANYKDLSNDAFMDMQNA